MIIITAQSQTQPTVFMHRSERDGGLRWRKAVTAIVTKHFVAPVVNHVALRFASV